MMSDEKILQAVAACRALVQADYPGLVAARCDEGCKVDADSPVTIARHALYMCDEIPKLLAEGRREKVMRWLGFLQGMMWTGGYVTLRALKEMNMPDPVGGDS